MDDLTRFWGLLCRLAHAVRVTAATLAALALVIQDVTIHTLSRWHAQQLPRGLVEVTAPAPAEQVQERTA
ncbi:hypothetical protein FHR32_006287 [Streptosporangium album]|uniref:Uncharacterized protein n=1 Tax=Streptosporangium album TaxID=47479 RepID=A0A7W7S105_9ACTN|nr:hypothetical protein [Streptosporangium album]MBB4941901.1 hypothetical protein [Streptosporangium album]